MAESLRKIQLRDPPPDRKIPIHPQEAEGLKGRGFSRQGNRMDKRSHNATASYCPYGSFIS
jgi:hypothetical protein